jgi:hypothetical protein
MLAAAGASLAASTGMDSQDLSRAVNAAIPADDWSKRGLSSSTFARFWAWLPRSRAPKPDNASAGVPYVEQMLEYQIADPARMSAAPGWLPGPAGVL